MHSSIYFLSLAARVTFAAVHVVQAGKGSDLVFVPQSITAVEGDTVVFDISRNHNVVSGSFGSPCQAETDGIYSGPYSETDEGRRKFVVSINNTDPIYLYCSVQQHCQSGMVGGINLP